MWKYLLFLIAIHTLGRLPLRAGYAIAEIVGRLVCWLALPLRRNVLSNLRRVIGEAAPPRDVRAAARRVFVNVAKYYVDLVRMPRMDIDEFFRDRFRYHGFDENVLPAVAAGNGLIVMSIHLGNPELGVQGMLPRGVKVFALTEPLEPPALSRLVDRLRASKGHEFAPVGFGGVRQAIQTVRRGGVVALMGDRDIRGPKARLPFFGEETMMPVGPMDLALRTGAAVIFSYAVRTESGVIEGFLEEPVDLERTGDAEVDVRTNTLRFLQWAEGRIRAHPDQWVVLESVWDGAADAAEAAPVAVGEEA